jgi:polyferredoxin
MEETMLKIIKKYSVPILIFIIFEALAVILGLTVNLFFLFNFSYIGFFGSLGICLMIAGYKNARKVSLLAIGLYMLVYLGIINKENLQLEGFFYWLAIGTWMATVLHYLVAKIFGPFIFGRAWCGYACWTAMILDLLPYKIPKNDRIKKLGILRIGVFIVSLAFFLFSYIFLKPRIEYVMYVSFIIGNIIYYIVGILLAVFIKDNRAFCKYVCPITVFLKPTSYFALLRIKVKPEKCISCNKCKRICPMNVDMVNNKRSRKNGTECILCLECVKECPKKALSW